MATHLPVFLLHILVLTVALGVFSAQGSRKEFRTKEMNRNEIILKDHTVLSKRTDPSQVIQLSWQPRVFLYRSFLSEEECDHLISLGKKSNSLQGNGLIEVRMSGGLSLDTNDEIVRSIEERISAWTFLPYEYSASLRVLHFSAEDSKQKYKYFDTKSLEKRDEPLLATVILYLSNVSEGGQILFPDSGIKIWSDCTKSSQIMKPSKGNAIVVFNTHLNATIDKSSFHARCPVLDGDMWLATKFFHMKDVKNEKDTSQSNDGDCTDEDENCPQWAAIGECQRNSVFMIGSPDYYGTCRKSCNAC